MVQREYDRNPGEIQRNGKPLARLARQIWRLTAGRKYGGREWTAILAAPDESKLLPRLMGRAERHLLRQFQTPATQLPLEICVMLAMQSYKKFEGRLFDLDHPVAFTEKMVWYKLFYDHPDMTHILDKYLFKDYIEEKLGPGYTAELYGMWTDMRGLRRDWKNLPKAFCLKSNCSYASRNIRLISDKHGVNKLALFREARRWLDPLNTCHNSSIRAYRSTTPRIIAEKLLPGENGELNDYKVYCFDGKPDFVGVVADRFSSGGAFSYYDLEWNRLPVTKRDHASVDLPMPRDLEEMLRLAERLSEGFPFMRVDFFRSEGKILVGELTPFSGNHFDQREFDLELGKKFHLPVGGAQ